MSRSCFFAPIHRKKFDYGFEFVKSYNKHYHDNNLFLDFSSIEEMNEFSNKYADIKFQSLLIDIPIDDGIITKKKLLGLKHIFETSSFDHVAVVDVDSCFIDTVDYNNLFKNFYQRKIIFCNVSSNMYIPRIINSPMKFFSETEQTTLSNILGKNTYFWFNDIPVYQRDYFNVFWKFIEPNYSKIMHLDFDYIIYVYYMLIQNNFGLKKFLLNDSEVITDLSVIEDQYKFKDDVFISLVNQSNSMWAKKHLSEMKNVFMLVHTDRK